APPVAAPPASAAWTARPCCSSTCCPRSGRSASGARASPRSPRRSSRSSTRARGARAGPPSRRWPRCAPPSSPSRDGGAERGGAGGGEREVAVAEPAGLTVRVESFVGPLDLLLHLCRTEEMDLSRLSVRAITDPYLAHLESVRFQDLEAAGSFMVMAATLIYL